MLPQAGPDGQPDFARKETVRASEVPVGSLMLVRPGEQVSSNLCSYLAFLNEPAASTCK